MLCLYVQATTSGAHVYTTVHLQRIYKVCVCMQHVCYVVGRSATVQLITVTVITALIVITQVIALIASHTWHNNVASTLIAHVAVLLCQHLIVVFTNHTTTIHNTDHTYTLNSLLHCNGCSITNVCKQTQHVDADANEPMAVGLEMFYRQHQKALDRYVYVHGSLGLLKLETAWDSTWG
jgi:hypothetical protein